MLRRSFRIGILVGLLGGAVAAAFKALQGSRTQPAAAPSSSAWTPIPNAEPVVVPSATPAPAPVVTAPAPAPPPPPAPAADAQTVAALQEPPTEAAPAPAKAPRVAKKAAPKPRAKKLDPWVQPEAGACPASHPVKGKLASKIFHVPGGFNYARTQPDRCYIDAAAAEADGLRQSKR